MTSHPNRNGEFELTFVNGASRYATSILGRYRRKHTTFKRAEQMAYDLLARFDGDGTRNAHPAIIYGPGLGPNGRTVA